MAGTRIVALPPMTERPALTDVIPIHNASTGDTEKVSISDLVGVPDYGWTSAVATWSYSSWTSGTRTGVITIPSDGTTVYTPGMRVKITQSTGGTKYGIIQAVTATTLTVFFPTGTTLNNEAISSPYYSSVFAPFGFNPSATNWTLTTTLTNTRTTTSTSIATLTDTVTAPIGSWRFIWDDTGGISSAATTSYAAAMFWSSDAATVTNTNLVARFYQRSPSAASNNNGCPVHKEDDITLAASTTFTLMGAINTNTGTLTANRTAEPASITQTGIVRLVSSYV